MPAAITAVRDGLKARLATISGLRTYDTMPDKPELPAGVVMVPELIEFDTSFGRGSDRYLIPIQMLASRGPTANRSQDVLDAYLAGSGASSVKAAIEGDVTLGGIVQTTRVQLARNYGFTEIGVDEVVVYLGVQFLVEVYA